MIPELLRTTLALIQQPSSAQASLGAPFPTQILLAHLHLLLWFADFGGNQGRGSFPEILADYFEA